MAQVATASRSININNNNNKKNTKPETEYEKSLRQIESVLSKKSCCKRCGDTFLQLKSIGRLQCLYHPKGVKGCKCEENYKYGNISGQTGCTSIDHCASTRDAGNLYTVFPASVWNDLAPLNDNHSAKATYRRGSVQRQDIHKYLLDDMQVVAVTSVEQAYHKTLRVHLFGQENDEPIVVSMHEAYDECAHLYHYASLQEISKVPAANKQGVLQSKDSAASRPIGDAPEKYATAQRLLFDLDVLEEISIETPDFVPYVIVFRAELYSVEQN